MLNNKLKYSLLYIEDESFIREMVVEYLSDYFVTIHEATNGKEALEIYTDKKPDIIITDIEMPQMNGLEFSTQIRKQDSSIPIIITTAYTNTEYLLHAIELRLIKYLIKPIEEEKLKEALAICFDQLEYKNPSLFSLTKSHQYDTLNHTLTFNKSEIISLTSSQSKFLDLLIKYKNRTVSYQELENYIWLEKGMSDSALRSLVHDLRKIIDKNIIKNVSKIGYKIQLYE